MSSLLEPTQSQDIGLLGGEDKSEICHVNVDKFLDQFESQQPEPKAKLPKRARKLPKVGTYTKVRSPETWTGERKTLNPKTGQYKCEICGKMFPNKVACTRHDWKTHLKLRCKCDLCGKLFRESSSFHHHYRAVHLGMTFKCDQCGKVFVLERSMERHQWRSCKRGKRERLPHE